MIDVTEEQADEAPPAPDSYKIIRGEDLRDLHVAVNHARHQGWIPCGGVTYVPVDPAQVMRALAVGAGESDKIYPYWQAMYLPS